MKIDVRARALQLTAAEREAVARRLVLALGRFEGTLSSVLARLEDINGPRGGEDLRCSLELRSRRLGRIRAEAVAVTVPEAVARAAEVASRSVARGLDRMNSRWTVGRLRQAVQT